MIKNYLLAALRNLFKNKLFSIINITGLSIGIGAALVIINFLYFEYSYDNFFSHRDRVYRVPMTTQEKNGTTQSFAFTYSAVAGALKSDFPEIQEAVRFKQVGGLVSVDEKVIGTASGFWADQQVFQVLDFPFLYGDERALSEINNVVITKKTAIRLFGEADARGKTFSFFFNEIFTVAAVLDDIPENSHIQFDFLLPFQKYVEVIKGLGADADNNWGWSDFYTYALLKPGPTKESVEQKLSDFAVRYKGEKMKAEGYHVQFYLQPLDEIHTQSAYDYELSGNGNFTYLKYIAIAAIFILFMAWLNYVNLTTSRSLERAKEVGIRKASGAYRFELIKQFLLEAFVINSIAIVGGIVILFLLTNQLSHLISKTLSVPPLTNYTFWGPVAAFLVTGSLLSGFYPAFILSSFKPFEALKGKILSGAGNKNMLRKALVVVQVALSVILISGTLGIVQQLQYMRKNDLGVNIDKTLILRDLVTRDSTSIAVVEPFINELNAHVNIASVTASTDVPGKEVSGSANFKRPESTTSKRCRNFEVDENFFSSYEMTILEGRGFVKGEAKKNLIVINETARKILDFESNADAIDREITLDGQQMFKIIGVVKDYHQKSLQHDYSPTIFFLQDHEWYYYSLKIASSEMTQVVADAESIWKKYFPETPFNYFFLNEYYDAQYKSEKTFSVMLSSFTLIGIVIASLGLLGLSIFTITKRSKEIGIRKVLGASVQQVMITVIKEYLALTIIAFGIAIPISFILVNKWMEIYPFRISLGVWFFVSPLALILGLTILSVGGQAIRAAISNPVKALRTE
jgi:putative ABC transport system permease protein